MAVKRQDLKNFRHPIFAVSVETHTLLTVRGPYNNLSAAKGQRTRLQREYPLAAVTVMTCLEPHWEEVLD